MAFTVLLHETKDETNLEIGDCARKNNSIMKYYVTTEHMKHNRRQDVGELYDERYFATNFFVFCFYKNIKMVHIRNPRYEHLFAFNSFFKC